MLRVGSLFSGMGGFDLAAERAGMRVAWQCEIDPNARRVLAHHWPDVSQYEDVTTLDGNTIEAVDVLVGGFPCQDLSVAGRRAGLAGERSGLWWEFHRLIGELRPRWALIENVPGLLSSNRGRDMGTLLWSLGELGYGWAYRVLDAQHFGVPQRRRRVFIVGCAGDWKSPATVLFEPESSLGHPTPRRTQGQDVAGTPGARTTAGGFGHELNASGAFIPMAFHITQDPISGDVSPALSAGNQQGCATVGVAIRTANTNANGHGIAHDVTHTLDGANGQAIAFTQNQVGDVLSGPIMHALATNSNATGRNAANVAVAFTASEQANSYAWERDVYPTLNAQVPNDTSNIQYGIRQAMQVRRLTPMECLRLQGFPDDWLDLDPSLSDSAKYRLCGNAVVVPVVEWIMQRIARQDA